LERVLSVFQQENFIDRTNRLKRYEYEVSSELLALILKQLQKAGGDSELHKQIEEEENALHEFEATQRSLLNELEQKNMKIENFQKELEQAHKELLQSKKESDEKERYIQELVEKLKEKES